MNRDAETVPARHETPDIAELRRLAEAATPGPWSTAAFQLVIDAARRIDVGMCGHRDDAAFIAAANPAAVLALLDDADALRAELAHMTEARDNARAEVERLTGVVEAVRKLADRIDRHTEIEIDPVEFRDADTGGWWEVSDVLRATLDGAES